MTSQPAATPAVITVTQFSAWFDDEPALKNINLQLHPNERLAIIGPSRSGKTTFLRSLNRLNDLNPRFQSTGQILFNNTDIYSPKIDLPTLRRQIGMVYATPNPLPWSIYDNLAYGPRLAGTPNIPDLIEQSLRNAFLWDEVKDRLKEPALNLSGGQQQRLCLARVLALQPHVLILDEPCSGLDPISTAKIEEATAQLKSQYSIILVTNNTKQAARASERTAFFLMSELIEIGDTTQVFTNPTDSRTNAYITGHFG